MKFLDIFSGVGGFRSGLESEGFEAYGWVEFDKFARKSYEAIYDTEGEWTREDITEVTDEDFYELKDKVDIIVGGSPCQSFSYAGQRRGFEDTRGTLFFDYARAVKNIQPKYLIFENVKGLVGNDKGRTLDTIVKVLNDNGYIIDFQILNSKFFGVPQNRERIFIVGVRDDLIEPEEWIIEGDNVVAKGKRRIKEYEWARTFNFDYPQGWELDLKLKDIMEPEVEERFYLNKEQTDKLVLNSRGIESDIKQVARYDSATRKNTNQYRTYSPEGISPSLTSMGGGGREPHVMTEVKDVGFIDRRGTGKQHQSNTVYNEEGLSPTMQARDYKDPAKVLIGASRGRNPANSSDRTTGAPTEQRLEINENGTSNTLTSVQKDNYVVEIGGENGKKKETDTLKVLSELREEIGEEEMGEWCSRVLTSLQNKEVLQSGMYGNSVHKETEEGGQRGELVHSSQEGERIEGCRELREMWSNKKHRCTSQGRELEKQFIRQLGVSVQELSYAESQTEKSMQDLWGTTQGSRVLQQALLKIQEIWEPSLYEEQNIRIRKLTPLETWRLQSFTDEQFQKAQDAGVSNSQLYKQAGNAVTVNVITELAKKIKDLDKGIEL